MPPARASTKRRVVSIDECKEKCVVNNDECKEKCVVSIDECKEKCVREGVPIEEDDVL